MSAPHLFPSAFLEFQDSCTGPLLYRNQPSRESNGVRLNDYMQKYNVGQYKGGDFIRLGTNLRNTTRMWNRLPESIKKDFLKLMVSSNSDMAKDIVKEYGGGKKETFIEAFGEDPDTTSVNTQDAVDSVNSLIDKLKDSNVAYDGVKAVQSDNKMSIFIITIVAIVAVVIGFLVACAGSSM